MGMTRPLHFLRSGFVLLHPGSMKVEDVVLVVTQATANFCSLSPRRQDTPAKQLKQRGAAVPRRPDAGRAIAVVTAGLEAHFIQQSSCLFRPKSALDQPKDFLEVFLLTAQQSQTMMMELLYFCILKAILL